MERVEVSGPAMFNSLVLTVAVIASDPDCRLYAAVRGGKAKFLASPYVITPRELAAAIR